ncbi:substrate-binding domain-containing protein, partial [Mesorhizobium sp.]|uniref:substrate-binding domain-containing protein n=1 Tax=Mesorhizobium sp. TaxID=1871066 RepID=UPI001212F0D5
MKTIAKLLCGVALAAVAIAPASAKDLNKVGISVGLLGNPFFVATIKGIEVAAFDVSAPGADVTVMTNNVKAGEAACQYLIDHTGGKGDYVILNGPASSSILERVKGCKDVLAKHPDIK